MCELRADGKAEWTIAGVDKRGEPRFQVREAPHELARREPDLRTRKGRAPQSLGSRAAADLPWRRTRADLAAAREPYKTLFAVGAVTGARMSECLGLAWADLGLDDLDAAEVRFEHQVDRQGQRQPLKTDESRRAVEIPRQLAPMLVAHKLRSADTRAGRRSCSPLAPAARSSSATSASLREARKGAPPTSGGGRRFRSCTSVTSTAARSCCSGCSAELPRLPAHRSQRSDLSRRICRRGRMATRTQEQHHHPGRLLPRDQERRAHRPAAGPDGARYGDMLDAATESRPEAPNAASRGKLAGSRSGA